MLEEFLYRKCPKFEFCNAPRCPLDRDKNNREKLPHEEKCTAQKRTIRRIVKMSDTKKVDVVTLTGTTI